MVSKDDAHRAAERLLNEIYGDEAVGSTIVIQGVGEVAIAWIVAFDLAGVDTDDPTKLPMVRNVIVPKDGGPAHLPPTRWPILDYLSKVESGERNWPAQ